MADRTSAEIFGSIFEKLSEEPDTANVQFVTWLWEMAGRYDFSDCQMECDEALVKLGLATTSEDEYGRVYHRRPRG